VELAHIPQERGGADSGHEPHDGFGANWGGIVVIVG